MTQKIVITGPSSSGKSRVLREFKQNGYEVLEEVAEDVLKKMPSHSAENIDLRQRIMSDLQYYKELDAEYENIGLENKIIILDRGLHDYLGFSHFLLGEYSQFPKEELIERYSMVFSLQNNGFIKNDIRIEKNREEAERIYEFVLWEYIMTGHKIINVPNLAADPSENARLRKNYIEKKINEKINNQKIYDRQSVNTINSKSQLSFPSNRH